MREQPLEITESDLQALVDKLVALEASLTPPQRALFRSRILASMPDASDVEGHAWEMRWQLGAEGVIRQWVWVDPSSASGERRA